MQANQQATLFIYLRKLSQISVIICPSELLQTYSNFEIYFYKQINQSWSSKVDITPIDGFHGVFSLSRQSIVITNMVKVVLTNITSTTLQWTGLQLYGCEAVSAHSPITSYTWNIHKHDVDGTPPKIEVYTLGRSSPLQYTPVVDVVVITYVTKPTVTCNMDQADLADIISSQIQTGQSELSIVNVSISTDDSLRMTLHISIQLRGKRKDVSLLKSTLINLSNTGHLQLPCISMTSRQDQNEDLQHELSDVKLVVIVVGVILFVVLLICLIVCSIYLRVMSGRYRDITNELTTMRKLKVFEVAITPSSLILSVVKYNSSITQLIWCVSGHINIILV